MAIYADITADQGSNYTSVISVVETNGIPVDLTNYQARGQIRKNYTSTNYTNFVISIVDPATLGKLEVSLTSAVTAAMKPGRYVYDIEVVSPTSVVTRVIEGQFNLTPSVTRVE